MLHHINKLTFFCLLAILALNSAAETLIVLNKDADSVYLLNADNGELYAQLSTGPNPHELAISPDGHSVAISDYQDGIGSTITLINVQTTKESAVIQLPNPTGPHGIAWMQSTNQVLVTAEALGSLLVIGIDSESIHRSIPINQQVSHMLALSADEKLAYVTNIVSGSVSIIELASGRQLKHIPTGKGAEGIAINADGSSVWVSNQEAQTISIINTETGSVEKIIEGLSYPVRVAIMPNDQHAVVTNLGDDTLRIFSTESYQELERINLGSGAAPTAVLPHYDGQTVFVSLTYHNEIAVIDATSWTVIDHYKVGKSPDGMALTPQTPISTISSSFD